MNGESAMKFLQGVVIVGLLMSLSGCGAGQVMDVDGMINNEDVVKSETGSVEQGESSEYEDMAPMAIYSVTVGDRTFSIDFRGFISLCG